MADDKIVIEVCRNKNADEFTKLLSEAAGRLETGSASAYTAAMAAALMERAAAMTAEKQSGERLDYILRNAETIRAYMVHLIDEDVKSRGPLKKALKEGGAREIEACRQPACCINAEIINMMLQTMQLIRELCDMGEGEAMHYIGEAAELALCAVRCSRRYILDMASKCSDETYKYVTRRENDISLEQCLSAYEAVNEKIEKAD